MDHLQQFHGKTNNMTPIIYTDFYKTEHHRMYPEGTTLIYSNLTPRKSRMKGIDSVVVFGIQHFIKKYLIKDFKENFFDKKWEEIDEEYKYAIPVDTSHIKKLHDLGYLPLEIKALPEGMRCPIRVPCMTIKNTHSDFYWLTNYLETLISCQLWQPITSATIAAEYYKLLSKYALETTGSIDFVQWQGHDFSMRGLSSLESAITSGMGHLTSFHGTDVIPSIYEMKKYYKAEQPAGGSVPASEHSVMCLGNKDSEIGTFTRLMELYPTGILSVVSDTWDLWKVLTVYLPHLKDKVLARDGKLVIRPDSGDPVDIICGKWKQWQKEIYSNPELTSNKPIISTPEDKGVIELLWDTFGGTINKQGYKELDSHIGAIYGDSISLERAEEICERLKQKGFASTNIVFGIGSYTYQMNTRDTFGFAMKATYGEVKIPVGQRRAANNEPFEQKYITDTREIFKDPITDDGTKKSAKGLIRVDEVLSPDGYGNLKHDTYIMKDQCTWEEEKEGELKTVFLNGSLTREYTLDEVRNNLKK